MTNYRILAQDHTISGDTRATGINNNDLIIGPSGSGKTRGYVQPNLLQMNESCIITDTKGSLYGQVGPVLRAHGFRVLNIDFMDPAESSCGYNPLRFIRREGKTGLPNQQDMLTLSAALIPIESSDPYWDRSARNYVTCLVSYVLECLPEEEQNLGSVMALFNEMTLRQRNGKTLPSNFSLLLEELGQEDPDSYAYRLYRSLEGLATSEKTYECVRGMIAEKLTPLCLDDHLDFYRREPQLDFRELGRKKTAVFLTVSDLDRSMDRLVNLFYTQALQTLCTSADRDYSAHALPVPVRLYLDDFASGTFIPDFDNITSVIRSRNIAVSVILQSKSQLDALYGEAKAATIMNNCDNCLYLGGQDVGTAQYVSMKANRTLDTILSMPLSDAWLFTRGRKPAQVRKFELTDHPLYHELPESKTALHRAAANEMRLADA